MSCSVLTGEWACLAKPAPTKGWLAQMSFPGFPGGRGGKNPPTNAGDMGFEPWSRKIPHAAKQLSLRTTTTEPVPGAQLQLLSPLLQLLAPMCLEPGLHKRSHCTENPTPKLDRAPAHRNGKAHMQQQRPRAAINKSKYIFLKKKSFPGWFQRPAC